MLQVTIHYGAKIWNFITTTLKDFLLEGKIILKFFCRKKLNNWPVFPHFIQNILSILWPLIADISVTTKTVKTIRIAKKKIFQCIQMEKKSF